MVLGKRPLSAPVSSELGGEGEIGVERDFDGDDIPPSPLLRPPSFGCPPPSEFLKKPDMTIVFKEPPSFSFAVGGWLKVYLFGAGYCLQCFGLDKVDGVKFAGASAGALTAVGLALDCDFKGIKDFSKTRCVAKVHQNWRQMFNLRQFLNACLDNNGNGHDWKKANGKAEVAITALTPLPTARRIKHFESEEDLRSALIASCTATPLAGFPFWRKGEFVLDGGVTAEGFQPIINEKTFTVSPFYFANADVKPSRYVPLWWAVYPPSADDFDWCFQLGFDDMLEGLKKKGIIPKSHGASCSCKMCKMGNAGSSVQMKPKLWKRGTPGHSSLKSAGQGIGMASMSRILGYGASSWLLDFLLLMFFICVWAPIAIWLIYVELFVMATVSFWTSLFTLRPLLGGGEGGSDHWMSSFDGYLSTAFSLRLLFKAVPLLGHFFTVDEQSLIQHSLIYRLHIHLL